MYENQTEEVIKKRMINNVPSDVDKAEGSFIYDALSPMAGELAKSYIELDNVLEKAFARTSSGKWLDKRAEEFGLTRKAGLKAYGQVEFQGAVGASIPKGTEVQTEGGLKYLTLSDATITEKKVIVPVEAKKIGSKYNVPSGTINQLPVQITGINNLTNKNLLTNGANEENDEELLKRLLLKVRTPATSGNKNHYKLWALEVVGIGDVKVFPLHQGPGTVKVVVIDSNKGPASEKLVDDVKNTIQENKPIGATVTVKSADKLDTNISVTVKRDNNYSLEQVVKDIKTGLNEYLKEIAFKKSYVSYAKIFSIILSSEGVLDCSNLLINGGNENITINEEQVAILGQVVVNE